MIGKQGMGSHVVSLHGTFDAISMLFMLPSRLSHLISATLLTLKAVGNPGYFCEKSELEVLLIINTMNIFLGIIV